jgi:hypothetical protein
MSTRRMGSMAFTLSFLDGYGAETLGTCGSDKPVVITEGKVTSPDMRTSNPKFFRIYVVTMR